MTSSWKRRASNVIVYAALIIAASSSFALPASAQDAPDDGRPVLEIPIPNVEFSGIIREKEITIPWLAQYIGGVYTFLLSIVGILAAVMMVVGGFQYLTSAGDSGKIGAAKKRIIDAMIGLLLALGSYTILFAINPKLVKFKGLEVLNIPTELYTDGGDTEEEINPEAYTAMNVYCPKSGGAAELPKVIASLEKRVAYRFGGKGGGPSYKEKPTGPYYKEFNDNCPAGNLCLDCSGFVNYVLRCAGLKAPGGGTGSMFNGAEVITSVDADQLTVNGVPLQPGDLFGYTAAQSKKTGVGHVLLYIGNGQVAESHGGRPGRLPGANPRIKAMPKDNSVYKHIRRVSQ